MMGVPRILDQIRYVPHTLRFLFSDGTEALIEPSVISKITVENYYVTSFVPVLKVEFAADFNLLFRLTADKTKVVAHMRMDYYPYTKDDERDKLIRTLFNMKFAVYLEDDKPELHSELNKVLLDEMKVGTNDKSDSATNKQFKFSVFLYEQSVIDWAYGSVSGVVASANMQNTIMFLLSKLGKTGIMSPMDNKNTYNDIYLPAMARVDLIKYLNAQYGFYNHGYSFFADFDMFYFLDRSNKCTAWVKGTSLNKIIVNVKKSDDVGRFDYGSKTVIEDKAVYINIEPNNLEFDTPSVFNNALIGSHLRTINTKTTKIGDEQADTLHRGRSYDAFMNNKFDNKFAEKEFVNDLESENMVISFSVAMANRFWFSPNKEIVMLLDNPKLNKVYGGSYKVTETIFVLYNSGDFMENTMFVRIKK